MKINCEKRSYTSGHLTVAGASVFVTIVPGTGAVTLHARKGSDLLLKLIGSPVEQVFCALALREMGMSAPPPADTDIYLAV